MTNLRNKLRRPLTHLAAYPSRAWRRFCGTMYLFLSGTYKRRLTNWFHDQAHGWTTDDVFRLPIDTFDRVDTG